MSRASTSRHLEKKKTYLSTAKHFHKFKSYQTITLFKMSEMDYFDSSDDSEDIRRRKRIENIKTTTEEYATMMLLEQAKMDQKRDMLRQMQETGFQRDDKLNDDNIDNIVSVVNGEDDQKINNQEFEQQISKEDVGESITSLINTNFIDLEAKLMKEFKSIYDTINNIEKLQNDNRDSVNTMMNKQTTGTIFHSPQNTLDKMDINSDALKMGIMETNVNYNNNKQYLYIIFGLLCIIIALIIAFIVYESKK